MIFYRLTDRFFSRHWRRTKNYTEKQLMLVARHQGCLLEKFDGGIRVKKAGKVVANFEVIVQPEKPLQTDTVYEDKLALYSALRNPNRNRIVIHGPRIAVSVANSAADTAREVGRRSSNG
jgi:hypothetical protein